MLLLSDSNSQSDHSSISKSSEPPKFTKIDPRSNFSLFFLNVKIFKKIVPFYSQRKSKLQSLISCQNTAVSNNNIGVISVGSQRLIKVFYEAPMKFKGTILEINLRINEEAKIEDLINVVKQDLKSQDVEIVDDWNFVINFAKKTGKPKNDLPGHIISYYSFKIQFLIALEQSQALKDCGDCGLFYLKAEENQLENKEETKLSVHKATRCSSSFGNEVYRGNSLLLEKRGKKKEIDEKMKEKSWLEKFLCCCSKQ